MCGPVKEEQIFMAYKTINPYNNELIKEYPNATDAEISNALALGDKLYHQWKKNLSVHVRLSFMKLLI